MSFRHDMRGKSKQQQAIVSQRDREEQRRKEEFEKHTKEKERKSLQYKFDYEDVKSELSEKELSHFADYLNRYKNTIIKEVVRNEKLKLEDLETPLEIGENDIGNNRFRAVYKTFQFVKINDKTIKVTKIT